MNKFNLITLSLIALSINSLSAGESFTIEGIKSNNSNTISKDLSNVSMKQENGSIMSSAQKKFDGLQMSLTGTKSSKIENGSMNIAKAVPNSNTKSSFSTLTISSSNNKENGMANEVKNAIKNSKKDLSVNSNVMKNIATYNVKSNNNNFCCEASPSKGVKKSSFNNLSMTLSSEKNAQKSSFDNLSITLSSEKNAQKSSFDNLSMALSSGKVIDSTKENKIQHVNSLSVIPANNEVRAMEKVNNFTIKDVRQVMLDSTKFLYANLNRFLLKNGLQYKTLKDGMSLLNRKTGKTVADINMSRVIRLMKPIVEGTKCGYILNDRLSMLIIKQLMILGGLEENKIEINNLRNGLVSNGFSEEAFNGLEKIYKMLNEKVREENKIGYDKEKDIIKLNTNVSEKTIWNNIENLTKEEKDIIRTDIEFYLYNNAKYLSSELEISEKLIKNYLFIDNEESMNSKLCKVIRIAKSDNKLLQNFYYSLTYNGMAVLNKILSEPVINNSKANNSSVAMPLLSQNVTNINFFGFNFDPSMYQQIYMWNNAMSEMNKFVNNMIASSSVFVLNQHPFLFF